MEENNSINSNINTPPVTPTPSVLIEQPKSNNFIVTLLSTLLFIAVLIAGFFAYQTQRLVKELTMKQPSSSPVATNKPSTLTQTYADSVYKYTVKYPEGWIVVPTPTQGFGGVASFANTLNKFEIGKQTNEIKSNETLKEYFTKSESSGDIQIIDEKELTLGDLKTLRLVLPLIHGDSGWKYGVYYSFVKDSNVYFLEFYTNDYSKDIILADEIISTFKFDSSDMVACTADAKLCPDGSAVGRSGPKCEFAACPTVKPTAVTSPQP